MTAHDPRVTLTEVLAAHRPKHRSVEGPNTTCTGCDWTTYVPFGSSSFAAHSLHLAEVIESEVIAARLAPIRALAEVWTYGYSPGTPSQRYAEALRAALDAPVSASQDHDGAEGQGQGERAGERDWCPMDEDVTDHVMGDQWQHGDGRYCRHHYRLNAWVFGAHPTTECLRDHERSD